MEISKKSIIAKTAILHEDVIIEDDVRIRDYAVIYPGCIIKKGADIFEHCVIGRPPKAPGCTARPIKVEFDNTIIGENTVCSPGVIVYSGTRIGRNTLLGDYCSIREECVIGDFCLISRNVSVNYATEIGSYTKVLDNTHITGNMKIGNNVFISTLVATTNDNAMGKDGYDNLHIAGAIIEDDVRIGAAANILPNITIGKGAVVGAGALVTKNVERNTLVMGAPARVIRSI